MQTLNLMKLKPSLGALYVMPSGQEMDGVSSTAARTHTVLNLAFHQSEVCNLVGSADGKAKVVTFLSA